MRVFCLGRLLSALPQPSSLPAGNNCADESRHRIISPVELMEESFSDCPAPYACTVYPCYCGQHLFMLLKLFQSLLCILKFILLLHGYMVIGREKKNNISS